MIPLFAPRDEATRRLHPTSASDWDRTWIDDPPAGASTPPRPLRASSADARADEPDFPANEIEEAEGALVRKLRTRQLSVTEARRVLRERGLDDESGEEILERLGRHGYLDDARLAEQLSYAAVTRKGQGRRAVAHALTARGIPRDVIDVALAELPDDDLERALDVARARAHRVGGDRESALRRLVGQLTRRGFPSSIAMTAARTALDERG